MANRPSCRRKMAFLIMTVIANSRLSPMPPPLEATPLVMSVAGRSDQFLSPTAIYLVVKEVFRRASAALEATDPSGARR